MTIRRITISVPEAVARRIKKAAGPAPVSTWVTELIEERLDNTELEQHWEAFCREVAPTRDETKNAEKLFKKLTTTRGKRGAA